VPADSICLPLSDPGIATGAMITDICRTYKKKLFRHADHVARFLRDCNTCFIPISINENTLLELGQEAVRRHPGPGELLLNMLATPQTLVVRTFPLEEDRYRSLRDNGACLWPTAAHPGSAILPAAVKHRNRLHWHIAQHQAPPGSLPLTTDAASYLLETAIGNLLLVRGGAVWAARPGTVLDSISQHVVRELCDAAGIPWHEGDLTPEADEAMLCGTGFGLVGISSIGPRCYPCPGPMTQRLQHAWATLTG
jgi:branched-subunit amino acid aminotransferase/4-amino-4-deoxychorismate lyase